ncbi:MAG: peptidoglycan editing factor PgeF [Anaerolineales bacterium]
MPFHESSGIRFFTFETLQHPALRHAILTRRGGSSPHPWTSLNLGGTIGDQPERVRANLSQAMAAADSSTASLAQVWQVHSADVIRADAPNEGVGPVKADGMVTAQPGVSLLMRFADCVPILVFDPIRIAIGVAHAGWLGTVRGVSIQLVSSMVREFGSRPEDLIAGLGPSIGPDHYPVGSEVAAQVEAAFGARSSELLVPRDGQVFFDLWGANRWQLESTGIRSVELAGICTACHLEDWYSHRGERGQTGRFGAVLALNA